MTLPIGWLVPESVLVIPLMTCPVAFGDLVEPHIFQMPVPGEVATSDECPISFCAAFTSRVAHAGHSGSQFSELGPPGAELKSRRKLHHLLYYIHRV